jgi:hypothetical protein
MITRKGLRAVARVAVAVTVLSTGLVALAAPAGAASAWRVVPTAPGTLYGHLDSVSCPIPTSCFAVGVQDSPSGVNKMIERWNGKKWTAVASPNPSGAISSALSSVYCRAPSSCIAVGQYNTLVATRTLILHWNGKAWSQKPSPNPPNMPVATLAGVHCASATSCFAVGSAYVSTTTSSAQVTLIEHWDGVGWTIVPSPNQPSAFDSSVAAVACPGPTTCFAVGSYEIQNLTNTLVEQWDGTTWTIIPSPNAPTVVFNELAGVSCSSPTSCFAVGSGNGTLAEQWDGSTWTIVPSPNPTGATDVGFAGVSCPSASRCVAVGDQFKQHGFQRLVEMWDGSRWTLVGVPVPSGTKKSDLSGVSCATPTNCFAVGDFRLGRSRRPLLEHYS